MIIIKKFLIYQDFKLKEISILLKVIKGIFNHLIENMVLALINLER